MAFVRGAMDTQWEYGADCRERPKRRPFDYSTADRFIPDPSTLRCQFIVLDADTLQTPEGEPARVWLDGNFNECIPPYKHSSKSQPQQASPPPSIKHTSPMGTRSPRSPLEDEHTSSRSNTGGSSSVTCAIDSLSTSVDD